MLKNNINCFLPIIDNNCHILILGSIPGIDSLTKNEYYGHKRNAFWNIIFSLYKCDYTDNYAEKKQLLLNNNIAVWDVIKNCNRNGSLDSNIKDDEANDFDSLFKQYPKIKHVFFNGTKAHDTYKRKVGFDDNHNFYKMPSTSPAHAIKFEKKLESWSILKTIIHS